LPLILLEDFNTHSVSWNC